MPRLKDWCWHSVTIFWSYVQIVSGFILTALPFIGGILLDPDVKSELMGWIPHEYAGLALMIIGVITFFARYRTL